MSPKTIKRLEDSRDACNRIREFLKGVSMDTLLGSALLQSAVERQLEIIGEALGAAAKEDDSLVEIIPDLPRIVGLRNRLIHGYDSVDPELVWDVTQTKIPVLKKQLETAIRGSTH
ncbi:MAG: HepT-like ribonuclease domain-containing protein [Luteolibacter sp.]|uniref:HepT-like ribonuclease domain-containing protein n=1 Tax=Luteolibacter sp. TaxID=1962973 RepID=UPI003267BFD1